MPLDVQGNIAAGQLAFWAVIAIPNAVFAIRYRFRQDAGYLFLAFFSFARVTQASLVIAAQTASNPPPHLVSAAYIMFEAAFPILYLATLGFLGLAGQHSYSDYPHMTTTFRSIGLVPLCALALHIAGGVLSIPPAGTNPDLQNFNANTGLILRKAAAAIDAFGWLCLFSLAIMAFGWRYQMRSYRRKLLYAVTVGILALGVRAAYSNLEVWSSQDLYGLRPSENSTLAQFSLATGEWIFYLVLGLVMEFIAALLFFIGALVVRHRRRHRY